ncbi:MAG: tetratricopeptide repeat protein [bacterium]
MFATGPTFWPVLAQTTMRDVALFYGVYFFVFVGFMVMIQALRLMARRAMLRGQTEAALIWYDRLWFLFGPAVRKEIKPQLQINLAIVHASTGNRGRAQVLLNDARRGARKLKTPELLIQACVVAARLFEEEANPDMAWRALCEAKTAAETDHRKPGLISILQRIAEIQGRRGLAEDSLNTWHALRRLADSREEHGVAILALTHLGRAAYEDGQWDSAEESFSEAVSRARQHHCRDRSAILAYVLFGRIALQRGRYELARGYLAEAASLARKRGEARLECSALTELGRLYVENGRYKNAMETLAEAETIATQTTDLARQAMVAQVQGDAYLQSDSVSAARVHYERAESLLSHAPLPHTELLVRTGLALIQCEEGDAAGAIEALVATSQSAEKEHAAFERVCIYDALGLVHAKAGMGDEAQAWTAEAHILRAQLGIEAAISDQYRHRRAG